MVTIKVFDLVYLPEVENIEQLSRNICNDNRRLLRISHISIRAYECARMLVRKSKSKRYRCFRKNKTSLFCIKVIAFCIAKLKKLKTCYNSYKPNIKNFKCMQKTTILCRIVNAFVKGFRNEQVIQNPVKDFQVAIDYVGQCVFHNVCFDELCKSIL